MDSSMINTWRELYPKSQKFIYNLESNEGRAEIPVPFKGVITDLSHEAEILHIFSELKQVSSTTKNGVGDLMVLPFGYEVPIGKTEYKTILFFFYKNEEGLRALSINLTIPYVLLAGREKLILLDAIEYVHEFSKVRESKLPIDILLKNTQCLNN